MSTRVEDTLPGEWDTEFGVRRLARLAAGAIAILRDAFRVARQRRELASLDDRMLHDIGITHAEARVEAMRGFWDIPTSQSRGW